MPNRLRLCFAFVFLFLLIASARLPAQNVWFPTGPDGGKVTALAVHPNTQRIVYAGTDGGGVFKSADGGRTWFPVNNGLFNLFIRDLVIDPQAPDTLYLAAGYLPTVAGVYKTTDGGGIWRNVSGGLPTPPPFCGCGGLMPVTDLAIDPGTPRILYAVAGGRVYKTERGGGWLSASSGLNDGGVLTVEVAPSSPNVLYAGTVTGVYTSANRGSTWSAATTGVGAQPVRALAVDPRNARTVYAGTDANGVFKSTNGGVSWSPASQGLLDRQVFALAIDPSNPANFWAGTGQTLYKSTDAAGSWRQVPTGVPPSPVGVLAVAPSAPNVIFAGPGEVPWVKTGAGVFKSTNSGETWAAFQQGLKASIVNSLASAGAPGALFAGTSGGGVFRTDNGGLDWQPRNAGLPQTRDVLSLATDPTDPEVVYAGIGGGGGVYKSADGGASWTFASTGLIIPATSNALVSPEDLDIDPENPSIVFAAGSGGFYRSTDGAATWERVAGMLRDSLSLAIAPSDPSTIYAGGGPAFLPSTTPYPTLLRSRDGGTAWEALDS
ncbi:MAG TPA: YCF48-related protein, partial [Thermoanaerobaculia bacterium]|nr:YCF48-related protein [Thermoanaerobaculia bacterium]